MSHLIVKNYKTIISVILIILCLPILPTVVEIVFKLGQIVGTIARTYGSGGVCV